MAEAILRKHRLHALEPEESLLEHLPTVGTWHWVPRNKAAVVAAVREGVLSLPEACKRYMLTGEEFHSWADAIDQSGIAGLRASMHAERRKTVRQAISETGVAMLNSSNGVRCLITDISDQGARIQFEAPITTSGTFELHCEKSGRSWWVNVIWHRATVVGVRFTNPLSPPWMIKSGLGAWFLGNRHTVSIGRADLR